MIGFLIAIWVALSLIIGVFTMLVVIGAGMLRRGTLMPKSKLMRIILLVGSLLIIVGISLMGWLLATSVIEIGSEDGKTESLEFENLTLCSAKNANIPFKLKNRKIGAEA